MHNSEIAEKDIVSQIECERERISYYTELLRDMARNGGSSDTAAAIHSAIKEAKARIEELKALLKE